MSRQDRFEAISDDLGNNLVNAATKGDGSKVIEGLKGIRFKNKINEGRVECITHLTNDSTFLIT